jgi:hypothetical protein
MRGNRGFIRQGSFRFERRLTGFGGARKIVRIRMKCRGGASRSRRRLTMLSGIATRLAVRQFDAGL